MNDPTSEIHQKAREWVASAEEDLQFARQGMDLGGNASYRIIAYLSQQCAEKYLKAYLVFRRFRFSHSHDIAYLLQACARFALWPDDIHEAEELTIYATTTRYPGIGLHVTQERARRAIALAERVKQAVLQTFAHEGLDLSETQPPV